MQPLRHSYTNDTRGDGAVVVKRYQGPDSAARRQREQAMLDILRGRLPVPAVLGGDGEVLTMSCLDGTHGQELIDDDRAAKILRSCGQMLRRIHAIDVADVFPEAVHSSELVLVHGDYGPNNLLFDPTTLAVAGILDWEWAHPGRPIEDLAWCEWIVRMHHRRHVDALDEFFDAYGHRPAWPARQQTMLAQCAALLNLCQRWQAGGNAVRQWQRRLAITAAWTPLNPPRG